METAYIVFAHGSRRESANEAVRDVARELASAGGFETVEVAFLDCTQPDLMAVVGDLATRGATRIVVLPYFLTLGRHAAEDLPRIAAEASRIYPSVRVEIATALHGHPALVQVLLERAREATP
jgi:sirohydrochlorin ferrochelatase